jgi:signal transduction histidine kinase
MDSIVRDRVLNGRVVRVKIWTALGRILYSDEPRLIGSTYPLGRDEQEAMAAGHTKADLSDLEAPENHYERSYHKLLEVYLPVRAPGGQVLLFESYLRFSSITANGRRIWTLFAPVLVGGLLLLFLIQVPLALSMARRVRQGQRDREALLQHAIDSSEAERRRIARDLHDGVVQDLAGVSFSLAAATSRADEELAGVLTQAAADTRRGLRELRTLIVDIAPPGLHADGLDRALNDLVAPLAADGMETSVAVTVADLAPETETLLFRAAREALRNVSAHAEARRVELSVAADNGTVELVVADDGRGFSPDEVAGRRREGHVGLSLLDDLAHEAGGRLVVDSTPGHGTRVALEVPKR